MTNSTMCTEVCSAELVIIDIRLNNIIQKLRKIVYTNLEQMVSCINIRNKLY